MKRFPLRLDILCLLCVLLVAPRAQAVEELPPRDFTPEEKAVHDELIALRDGLLKAYEAKDIDGVLEYVDEQAIVTWQNGEVSLGRKGVKEFYERMVVGPNSEVADLKSVCTVDDWSNLYLDRTSAVARGRLDDDFTLRNGMKFHLQSRWTASLVKQGDEWKITAFHVSTNMFDNGVLDLKVNWARTVAGAIGGGGGLLAGLVLGFLFFRGRKAA